MLLVSSSLLCSIWNPSRFFNWTFVCCFAYFFWVQTSFQTLNLASTLSHHAFFSLPSSFSSFHGLILVPNHLQYGCILSQPFALLLCLRLDPHALIWTLLIFHKSWVSLLWVFDIFFFLNWWVFNIYTSLYLFIWY